MTRKKKKTKNPENLDFLLVRLLIFLKDICAIGL